MPSIKFFRRSVGHTVILVILFLFFPLDSYHFPFHLPTFRDHSDYRFQVDTVPEGTASDFLQ